MDSDAALRSEVKTFLIELTNAFHEGDYERVRAMYADDPGVYWVGTEQEYAGPEALARILREVCEDDDPDGMRVDLTFRTQIIVRPPMACVGTVLNIHTRRDGRRQVRRGRFTATLEKTAEGWKILHQHLSVPVPQEPMLGQG